MALVRPKILSEDQEPVVRERRQLPPGQYRCQIVGCELKKTSTKGEDMLSWKLEVTAPQSEWNRAWIFHNTMLEGPAVGMFIHFVHAAGLPDYKPGDPIDTDHLMGKFVKVTTIQNDYIKDGKRSIFPKVVDVEPDDTIPDFDADSIPF